MPEGERVNELGEGRMRILGGIFGIAAAVVLAGACRPSGAMARAGDPLAQARTGMVRCYEPDAKAKRCVHIIRFLFDDKGGITDDQTVTVQTEPLVVMRTRAVVTIEDGMVCEKFVPADFEVATFTIDGQPVDAVTTAEFREFMIENNSVKPGQTLCLRSTLTNGQYANEGFIEGKATGPGDHRWIWVDPAQGWRVD